METGRWNVFCEYPQPPTSLQKGATFVDVEGGVKRLPLVRERRRREGMEMAITSCLEREALALRESGGRGWLTYLSLCLCLMSQAQVILPNHGQAIFLQQLTPLENL